MKTICALLFALSIVTARAQFSTTNPPGTAPVPAPNQWLLSDFARRPEQTPLLTLEQKPNELRVGKITLSGIAVEAVKVDNPLQLFNPWAPPEYGESQDNATFGLITDRVTGWKLFAFEF
jgi:hypothetical protein